MTGQAARATYRLQMHAGFTFADAAAVTAYLGRLGVSHLYLSPILQAAPGSTHGYDVVDPTRVNRELGGDDGYRRLQDAAAASGLGQLLDVVPNHMAITGRDNTWWWDVLENGPASPYASYFDVDWDPPESKLRNLVLLPILGDHYGRELEAGRLLVEREGGGFVLHYYDHLAPLAPRSLDELLTAAARRLPEDVEGSPEATVRSGSPEATVRQELESMATAFGRLPISTLTDSSSVRERHRDKEILRGRLADLCERDGRVAAALDDEVKGLNGDVDRLDALLDRQNYRLAWWRIAGEELDYRRFFDINGLAGIRVEDPEVFADSHRLILEWLTDRVIDGVRIDHVDGLRDPHTYLGRLSAAAPGAWVLVEKILEGDEHMPDDWPVAGTTGYDWLNAVAGVLTDAAGAGRLTDAYRDWTGLDARFEQVVLTCKQAVLEGSLAADVSRLVARLALICEGNRRYRDYTRRDLRDCLAEVLIAFAVYRTYVQVGVAPSDTDRATVEAAVLTAGVRRPDLDEELLGLVRDLLLLRVPGAQAAGLALRFQQVSGPVMAKAVEDTAFYRYLPCSWLNEVGADPGHPGATVEAFHARNHDTQERYPQTMLATSSHDTKRSEDVRARLSVLAEMPESWIEAVDGWRHHHEARRQAPAPDRNTEWLLYQSLVGAWPIDADRIVAYLVKATREAKVYTSWTDPDPVYDESLRVWLGEAMADQEFLGWVDAFVARIRRLGWSVGLAQKLLTLTAPGVPDLYQGSECWDLSLVDPDNRRPVDYDHRRALLARVDGTDLAQGWAAEDGDGFTKLAVVARALAVRRSHPDCFGPDPAGAYQPLGVRGGAAAHAVGFVRGGAVATLVTRLPVGLEAVGGWGDTVVDLPEGVWSDHLGGGRFEGSVLVGDVLAGLPVALLVRADHPTGEPA